MDDVRRYFARLFKKNRTFTAQSAVKVRIFCEYQLEKCI